MDKTIISLSVKEFVDFAFKQGDIDNSGKGGNALEKASLGTQIHKEIQKKLKKDNFSAEHELEISYETEGFTFNIKGRADAVSKDIPAIYEIKTNSCAFENLKKSELSCNKAQAMCYAYIYALHNKIDKINIKLIYINTKIYEEKTLDYSFSFEELDSFFKQGVNVFLSFLNNKKAYIKLRDASISKLNFPFETYRKGQKQMIASVYKAIEKGIKLYAVAPTGIGKTISSIYPCVKSLKNGNCKNIFYLTAKTTTRKIASDTVKLLQQNGLVIRCITLYAKNKLCLLQKPQCYPENCPYANNYFTNAKNAVLYSLDKYSNIVKEDLFEIAEKFRVCPFEIALDISLWCDIIICDYNYLFDPFSYLQRYFSKENNSMNSKYVFLIDETHNLVDRGRDMFSAYISLEQFKTQSQLIKNIYPPLSKSLKSVSNYLKKLQKDFSEEETNFISYEKIDEKLFKKLLKCISNFQEYIEISNQDDIFDSMFEFYFELIKTASLFEMYDKECHKIYFYKNTKNPYYKMFCINPRKLLDKGFSQGVSSVLFSATLTPINYYFDLLDGKENDKKINFPSSFPKENREILIANDITTAYRKREFFYNKVAQYINIVYKSQNGNYFVFFPSYEYMIKIYEIISSAYSDLPVVIQKSNFSEEERENFINIFEKEQNNIGFCVMGGLFSEGIDLPSNKLIGSIIVGTGLPKVGTENLFIKSYYDDTSNETREKGFDYAYTFPGITKVLQSAGRVIRTDSDKGIILLLDERFDNPKYRNLFPEHFFPHKVVNIDNINYYLKEFWKDKKEL